MEIQRVNILKLVADLRTFAYQEPPLLAAYLGWRNLIVACGSNEHLARFVRRALQLSTTQNPLPPELVIPAIGAIAAARNTDWQPVLDVLRDRICPQALVDAIDLIPDTAVPDIGPAIRYLESVLPSEVRNAFLS